jgi:hypothetical protein
MPLCGIHCQDNFALLQILYQMVSFISDDSKNFVNDVINGVELDGIKYDLLR